jgi:hypothetical protein
MRRRRSSYLYWFALAGCMLCAIGYGTSALWTVVVMTQFGESVRLGGGELSILLLHPDEKLRLAGLTGMPVESQWSWHAVRRQFPMSWKLHPHAGASSNGMRVYFAVPLLPWVPLLGTLAWWFNRRHRKKNRSLEGECLRCGYDRGGLTPSAPCPECGHVPS